MARKLESQLGFTRTMAQWLGSRLKGSVAQILDLNLDISLAWLGSQFSGSDLKSKI